MLSMLVGILVSALRRLRDQARPDTNEVAG
jgi:hypothetical protein